MPKAPESIADITASLEAEQEQPEAIPAGHSKIRVLPRGDGKVSTGEYDRVTNSFPFHKRGDFLVVPDSVARAQEENGLVEIVS